MSEESSATLRDWLQLIRLPNVFTVLADTSAAFLLVAGSFQPVAALVIVLSSVVCLYWAGMVLNDVWDVEVDREQRSTRPLAAGRIAVASANRFGWALLIVGVVLAAACGLVGRKLSGGEGAVGGMLPGAVGLLLAIAIVLYDGPLKRMPIAPVAMGMCRFLSFLLGASAGMLATQAVSPIEGFPFFENHVLAMAGGFAIYIVGVTIMARGEAIGGQRGKLGFGLAVTLAGLALLAYAPQMATATRFQMDINKGFPLLIAALAANVTYRAGRAIMYPEPRNIQMTIKVAILMLIPLSATIAFLAGGYLPALSIFALLVPSMYLGSFLRVT